MKRADLLALAERVEKAAGADRVLDAEIACVVHGVTMHEDSDPTKGVFAYWLGKPWESECVNCSAWGEWTRFLDAAASLVPAGWVSRHEWDGGAGDPAWTRLTLGQRCAAEAKALTPALALTAAALRARAEEADDE